MDVTCTFDTGAHKINIDAGIMYIRLPLNPGPPLEKVSVSEFSY